MQLENPYSFAGFKKAYKEQNTGRLHLVKLPEEDDEPYTQDLFRTLTGVSHLFLLGGSCIVGVSASFFAGLDFFAPSKST